MSGQSLNVAQLERQLKDLLDFFPIEKMKLDVDNGEEYVARIAKTACRGIFDDTRDNVGNDADEKVLQIEKKLTDKIYDHTKKIQKLAILCDKIGDLQRDISSCVISIGEKSN